LKKFLSLTACVAVGALAVAASQGVSLPFGAKQGAKAQHAMKAELNIGIAYVTLESNLATEIRRVDDKGSLTRIDWKETRITLGDDPMDVPVNAMDLEMNPQMVPTKLEGGIEGADPSQLLIAMHFIPPTQKTVEPGATYKFDAKPMAGSTMPAYTYEGKYVKREELGGKPVHLFETTFKFEGDRAFEGKQSVWVAEDGGVAKLRTEFKNMSVPAAGLSADGWLTLERK
jgi:hypothetical protein